MNPPKPTLDDLRIERDNKPKSTSLGWLVALVVLVLCLGVAAAWRLAGTRAIEVHTATARESGGGSTNRLERTVLNASGYVTARRAATVSSKVTGKVIEVLVEEGMKVAEGQILARLDDTNVQTSLLLAVAQLNSAEKALEETRVRIKVADLDLARIRDLAKFSIAAQADLDHAEADAQSLKAKLAQQQSDVTVAERQVASWQQQLDDTIIRAPFAGIVTSKNAQPGEMISPISAGGGFTRTGICTIVDMKSLEVEIDVNESYINRVESGQAVEATLDAYPDWKIPCKVIAIIPTADRQKSTVKVRVGFDQLDPRILPEMGVKVGFRESAGAIPAGAHIVTIPKDAVQRVDGQDIVLVFQNGRAERRSVTVASTSGEEAIIAAGVNGGERVIVDGPKDLGNGTAVTEKRGELK